jgi:homoserine kinase type II
MAVFTSVSLETASELFQQLDLGDLLNFEGIGAGIENTNYFATSTKGAYVLTLFERLTASQLPFYLHLMKHLALRGIPVPEPQADAQNNILHQIYGKPAAVVNRLYGASELNPQTPHCIAIGDMLARMHLAGMDYGLQQPNLRGLDWWASTIPLVLPYLASEQYTIIKNELKFQQALAETAAYNALPRGPIHADLFKDNVLFEGTRLSGFFDFYFAGIDTFLFDIAVCLNDWCIDLDTGMLIEERAQAFIAAYDQIRRLTDEELELLPALLRAGALRFWTSRLWDFFLPRQASLLKPHDPQHFERILRSRLHQIWRYTRS